MNYRDSLCKHLESILGKKLETLNLAAEMMMFHFGEYALHSCCLTRIIRDNDILVTTIDYLNWDGEEDKNNDEWYFVEKYKDKIVGGVVISVEINSLYDVEIMMDNGVKIELFIKNGYNHYYDDENEQWVFFKVDDHSYPFITVCSKSVDIAEKW